MLDCERERGGGMAGGLEFVSEGLRCDLWEFFRREVKRPGESGPRVFRFVWTSLKHVKALEYALVREGIKYVIIKHPGGTRTITNDERYMDLCPRCGGTGHVEQQD